MLRSPPPGFPLSFVAVGRVFAECIIPISAIYCGRMQQIEFQSSACAAPTNGALFLVAQCQTAGGSGGGHFERRERRREMRCRWRGPFDPASISAASNAANARLPPSAVGLCGRMARRTVRQGKCPAYSEYHLFSLYLKSINRQCQTATACGDQKRVRCTRLHHAHCTHSYTHTHTNTLSYTHTHVAHGTTT